MHSDFDWMTEGDVDFSGPVKTVVVKEKDPGAELIKKRKRRPVELVRAERKLTPAQRFYVRMLVETETIAAAERRMVDAGFRMDRTTFYRWRQLPAFSETVHLMQSWVFECLGISKERVMNDAEKIKQIALTPQPVLYQGKKTGFDEVQLAAALRALELQAKGIGLQDTAAQRVQVNIDIDFSGRVDGVDVLEDDVIEGEFEYVNEK